jgi:hypothetical protein
MVASLTTVATDLVVGVVEDATDPKFQPSSCYKQAIPAALEYRYAPRRPTEQAGWGGSNNAADGCRDLSRQGRSPAG